MRWLFLGVLALGMSLQVAAIWRQYNPRRVEIVVGKPFPLQVERLLPDAGTPRCRSLIVCTKDCPRCVALATAVRSDSLDAGDTEWLVLGDTADARLFQTEHNLPQERVAAASLAPSLAATFRFEYLDLPLTPLFAVIGNDNSVLALAPEDSAAFTPFARYCTGVK